MSKQSIAILCAVVCMGFVADVHLAQRTQSPGVAAMAGGQIAAGTLTAATQTALIKQYCSGCHNDGLKSGGMSLAKFDAAHVDQSAEVAEKMIRKLRAGMMPPAGSPRPDGATIKAFAASMETAIDRAAATRPNPGRRALQRLNRTEYALSIRELLGIDVDVSALLPLDSMGHGFDNTAEALTFSPTLMEGYMRAASKISREALGDPKANASVATYKVSKTASQMRQVEGAPFGTRGGISVIHNFPADGEYTFRIMLYGTAAGSVFGFNHDRIAKGASIPTKPEQMEISVNGERVALMEIDPAMREGDPKGLTMESAPVAIKAGAARVSAAFIKRFEGEVDDLIKPIEHTLADDQISNGPGVTALPHLQDFGISGPHKVTGISDTASRRKVFSCRPVSPSEELACATKIVSDLARQAYRRPVNVEDLEGLMSFFQSGRKEGDFELGVRTALQAILASPHFIFRVEQTPATVKPGQNYRISDVELASRLSYFLWGTAPDSELVSVASQKRLQNPLELEKQVRRMLADRRSDALSTRFAAQWLRLPDLKEIIPDVELYPQFDSILAQAMKRETELFFDNIVREDRSVLDLLTADYTFVNERLAAHYQIPNIMGNTFRRVQYANQERRGLLGHGSILTLTSVANRTAPVIRGKWVMEVLLGTPPPTPPPNVPELEETKAVSSGKLLTLRERLEEHRRNPNCASCHRMMDPIGLSLENFDPTGAWRIKDSGVLIDASSELFDGTRVNGPASLRQAILTHSDAFVRTFTGNLMTYSLGRRAEYFDMPAVRAIVREAALNNNRFSSFVLGIVRSNAFQMNRAETTIQ